MALRRLSSGGHWARNGVRGITRAFSTRAILGDWCAFYINLDRRPDRRERLHRKLARGNLRVLERLERIEAVDGQKISLSDTDLERIVELSALERARRADKSGIFTIIYNGKHLVHFDDHLTRGGVACAMSHRIALQKLVEHPTAEWALILEDDVSALVPHLDTCIARILHQLPADWDAVFLGYHDHRSRMHAAVQSEPDDRAAIEAGVADVVVEPMRFGLYGLHAWMVRKQAAREILKHTFPIQGQVDHAISHWLACERGRTFRVAPCNILVRSPTSEEAADSDVQTMASMSDVTQVYDSLHDYMIDAYIALNIDADTQSCDHLETTWHDVPLWGMPPPPCAPLLFDSPDDFA